MLTLWHPHRELFRWTRNFDDFFGKSYAEARPLGYCPAVDIDEKEDSFVLQADLPGLNQKEIEITVTDGVLVLSGNREESTEEKVNGTTVRERRYGAFERKFRLGPNVAEQGIEATYKDGVLTVVLPKKEEAKPRQISVRVH